MADALSELSGPTNPDAQATVTDFHDYTEFFPSDLARSLTLIGKLNGEYAEDAQRIHTLTKTYGALPSIPASERPDALNIRRQVSQHLQHALRARAATVAEATRLCDVADTLYSRLDGIKKKLAAMPKPPSREPSPKNVKTRSPQASRSRKSDIDRTKLTLNPPAAATAANKNATAAAKEKKRSRRIIVPGEVLPPFDPNSPLGSDVSSSDDEIPPPSPIRMPASLLRATDSLLNSATKTPKILKTPKTPKIRPPGVMGTNVHSTVAGISVSNAMASLTPPPPDAVPGSEWQPWLSLTEWELNLLRRRMKKNANWRPSETMTRRELKERNRGPDAFAKAKAEAEARGETVLDEPAHKFSDRGDELRPIEAAEHVSGGEVLNVGMKLNEQKKQKKRNDDLVEALSRGDISHNDADYMAAITAAGQNVAAIYSSSVLGINGSPLSARSPESAKKESRSTTRKRKREAGSTSTLNAADTVEGTLEASAPPKKLKLVTTRPPSHDGPEPITASTTTQVPLAPEGPGTPSTNKGLDSGSGLTTAASSRPSRTPRAATPMPKTEEEDMANMSPHHQHAQSASPYDAPNTVPARARTSRGTGATNITLKLTQKAASAEPPNQRASRRRASETAVLHQQQQEQQLQLLQQQSENKTAAPTAASSRGKRSAPGMTVGGEEGGAKLSLTRRKNDPAKKKGGSAAGMAEDIDPNEPLYCLCNNVSWGTMVACENPSCTLEWYHLSCVGLEQPPGKRQRWWCPTCRKKLGIGQFGEKKK